MLRGLHSNSSTVLLSGLFRRRGNRFVETSITYLTWRFRRRRIALNYSHRPRIVGIGVHGLRRGVDEGGILGSRGLNLIGRRRGRIVSVRHGAFLDLLSSWLFDYPTVVLGRKEIHNDKI